MAVFEYNGATIQVSAGTGRIALKKTTLYQIAEIWEVTDKFRQSELIQACMLLAHTVSVTGDPGFHVPNGDATKTAIYAFCDAIMEAPETLLTGWSDAIDKAAEANAPHLLPPAEVDEKKGKNTKPSG